jgi:AcrR family transcriptional regulator
MDRSPADAARARRTSGGPVLQDELTAALKRALYKELAEAGYGKLSLEAVARRAGAGKAAIYRRWSGKRAMLVALLSDLAGEAIEVPDTGALRSDVRQFLVNSCAALEDPLMYEIVPDLLAEAARDPEVGDALSYAMHLLKREKAAELLQRAIDRGDLDPGTDVEIGLELLAGPLYWRLVVIKKPTDDDYFDRLTNKIVGALEA